MDAFAGRKGGTRAPSTGRDSSMWHYLRHFNSEVVRIVHMEYSDEAAAELLKCKVLSASLCEDPITLNANKCILISRQAAIYTFGGKYQGHLLSRCAVALAAGAEDPAAILPSIGVDTITSSERVEALRAYLQSL